ncbi:MAG: hypothetical protein GF418_07230 [Chitinivibrionales bacterium]|nr:hypothetical protein [Chitinivibrionales bacterium]MBD3395404.1 hypothetical protein [Chitinivibrionales bacterium]
MSIFEVIMLLCFGAAWPFSIYKSYRTGSSEGKSVLFLWIVLGGYAAGFIHKMVYSFDAVSYLYLLNGLMVLADIALFVRNAKRSGKPA